MPAEHPVPAEVAELAAALADQFAEGARGQLAELAELLTDARPVRAVPSDRWATLVIGLVAGGAPDLVASEQLDRARVTIVNTGTVTVALGARAGVTTTGSDRFPLPAGASLVLDTRAAVWAVVAAGGDNGEVTVLVESWDT
jgi:hypothetical protein